MKIQSKSFIVTGGCGALGGGTARAILEKGGHVIVFDVLPKEKGEEIVGSYPGAKGNAWYYQVNIADVDAVQAACAAALQVIPQGSLAGGVHCAALSKSRKWSNVMVDSVKDFADQVQVNVLGTFIVDACISDAIKSQFPEGNFAPRVEEERGVIINFASAVAYPVPARTLTYGPTKTAVLGITSAAADYLGPAGIRVCSVSPSVVASKMMGDRLPYFQSELDGCAIFPRRTAQPEEVVHGVIFLIENGLMNACDLRPDGAWRTISNWGNPLDPRSNAPGLE